MTLYVGVDVGKQGAISFLDARGDVVDIRPMPLVAGGYRGRDEFDLPAIRELFVGFRAGEPRVVTIERSQPLPPRMGGGIANYARGVACGFAWMLTGLQIPYQLVLPQVWQRKMLVGTPGQDTKQRSILAAQRLFPGVDLRRNGKGRADDGIADSLLIAEFGRRLRNPEPAEVPQAA